MEASLAERIKRLAQTAGFSPVGVARAADADRFDLFEEWLDAGHAGEMEWLHRHREARRHPASILANVRSVLMLGLPYTAAPYPSPLPNHGRIARYAQGPDYHRFIWEKLDELLEAVHTLIPGCEGRGVVDTAPLLERDFARRAGLGWVGKNTMLIDRRSGSYFFLAGLLLDAELEPDAPHEANHCGTCTACIDACPTDAITAPGRLDARLCISYHTIELRGPIPTEHRSAMGGRLFGCDICQEVCPWNRFAGPGGLPRRDELAVVDAAWILALSEEEFRGYFRGTAITRTKRGGLRRNAAIVLGNTGDAKGLETLRRFKDDPDPVVRESVEWAIARLTMNQT